MDSSTCSSLLTLPQELQDAIVRLGATHEKGRDLLSLSYTCKTLRATCLPVIYEDIQLSAHRDHKNNKRDHEREIQLIRAVSTSSSDLGRLIKKLQLRHVNPYDLIAEQMLPFTINLTHLTYGVRVFPMVESPGGWIDTKNLGLALAKVSRTLLDLNITLSLNITHDEDYINLTMLQPILSHDAVSIKPLVSLRSLTIPVSLLMGSRAKNNPPLAGRLPSTLVHLSLKPDWDRRRKDGWSNEHVVSILEFFVGNEGWRTVTPLLQTIIVHNSVWTESLSNRRRYYEAARAVIEENKLKYVASGRRMT
jgi:hypothetical protein